MKVERTEKQIATRFKEYQHSYLKEIGNKPEEFDEYRDETLVLDLLYGVAVSLSRDYRNADGFDRFKADLAEFLKDTQ